jgi:GT2 family glycosyltransferase
MCCYDTDENKRSEYTQETLFCLETTLYRESDRLFVIDNNSCDKTKKILDWFRKKKIINQLITLPENIGTARAINKAWKFRHPGENAVKLDNDVLIHSDNWVEALEEAIQRDPAIGIVGLKRKDLAEYPGNPIEWYDSKLYFLPHKPGESWIPFEECQHVMGTCQMYSSALLEKIGYLKQPGIYGFDDSLASLRARIAGFKTGFLPAIQIDHIDKGDNPYTQEKQIMAGKDMGEYNAMIRQYGSGEISIYWEDKD